MYQISQQKIWYTHTYDVRSKSLVRQKIDDRNLPDPFKIPNECQSWKLIVESKLNKNRIKYSRSIY